jgi:hypothetical protein
MIGSIAMRVCFSFGKICGPEHRPMARRQMTLLFLKKTIALQYKRNMIEVLAASAIETYLQGNEEPPTTPRSPKPTWAYTLLLIVPTMLAAYVSWKCNTVRNIGTVPKVIYAFFAGLFGTLYLIAYYFMVSGTCAPLANFAKLPEYVKIR